MTWLQTGAVVDAIIFVGLLKSGGNVSLLSRGEKNMGDALLHLAHKKLKKCLGHRPPNTIKNIVGSGF